MRFSLIVMKGNLMKRVIKITSMMADVYPSPLTRGITHQPGSKKDVAKLFYAGIAGAVFRLYTP